MLGSRKSLSSCRNCLQVSKDILPFPFEFTSKLLPKGQPGPQEPALHRRNGDPETFGRLLCTQFFDVAQHENGAEIRLETLNSFVQNLPHLLLRILLLG